MGDNADAEDMLSRDDSFSKFLSDNLAPGVCVCVWVWVCGCVGVWVCGYVYAGGGGVCMCMRK
jgi:hypothetical protein